MPPRVAPKRTFTSSTIVALLCAAAFAAGASASPFGDTGPDHHVQTLCLRDDDLELGRNWPRKRHRSAAQQLLYEQQIHGDETGLKALGQPVEWAGTFTMLATGAHIGESLTVS